MLKRYDIWALDYHELAVEEDEDGEWVKWEDIKRLMPVDEEGTRGGMV